MLFVSNTDEAAAIKYPDVGASPARHSDRHKCHIWRPASSLLLLLLGLPVSAAFADELELQIPGSSTVIESAEIIPYTQTIMTTAINTASEIPATAAPSDIAQGSRVLAQLGPAIDSADLALERGGTDLGTPVTVGGILTNGFVSDNRAIDVATGSNAIRDGAFANASGIPVVIQNTGANVLIQSATIVNVQLR